MPFLPMLSDLPDYQSPSYGGYDPSLQDERDRAITAKIQAGLARYTPQQQQELARNGQVQAWLGSSEVPDSVRQREMANLAVARSRIQPVDVDPHEVPLTPQQQISTQAWVDREGQWGAPGTTWVKGPKGWAPDRNSPNNDLEYMSRTQGEEAPPEDAGSFASPIGAALGSMAMGASPYVLQGEGPDSPNRIQPAIPDRLKIGQTGQKMQHAEQQHRWKLEEAQSKSAEQREQKRQAAYAKAMEAGLALQMKQHIATGEDTSTFQPNYDAAREHAAAIMAGYQEGDASTKKDDYSRRMYVGMNDEELPKDAQGKAELARRKKQGEAGAFEGEPVPAAWIPRLQKMAPDQLELARQMENSREDPTWAQFQQEQPGATGASYQQFLQLRRWLKNSGEGPLQVPAPAAPKPEAPAAPGTFLYKSATGKFGWDGKNWVPIGK